MSMPGFGAEASIGPTVRTYRQEAVISKSSSGGSVGVMPQLRFQSDPDLGSYLRCRANGGSELVCRFFGGLSPFTIGGLLF